MVISESDAKQPQLSTLHKIENEERLFREAADRWNPEDLASLKSPEELEQLAKEKLNAGQTVRQSLK